MNEKITSVNIKSFREHFYKALSEKLSFDGYIFKRSSQEFILIDGNHIFTLQAYTIKMNTGIVIKINGFYSSQTFNEIQKLVMNNYYSLQTSNIVGGSTQFIAEEYHEMSDVNIPNDFWWDTNSISIQNLADDWYLLYSQYLKPFLNKCRDIEFLNQLVNDYKIDKPGFIAGGYDNRILKGIILAHMAGESISNIENLALLYEDEVRKKKYPYLKHFIEVKDAFFSHLRNTFHNLNFKSFCLHQLNKTN
ncbi:hypothetical protein SOM12_12100 [Flavobacterium sp. CFBP9031]|uniref:hypothetical protein n=1 Tax=Flavobacterium sp. CFBP9031 TaxID=3096538 RepID=UPI002A6B659F|nr:hypothetical protein [Flavobacterium sp. CFBP9031]MDY0988159.1 hypothetical protein [Flavobacterium sp. CFBP9031]